MSWQGDGVNKHVFAYDHVFEGDATQGEVFENVGWHALRDAWLGYNSTIFAYGQTGSGKSHTMIGTDADPGLVRLIGDVLFTFEARAKTAATYDAETRVSVTCLEIYNEQIHDLLRALNPQTINMRASKAQPSAAAPPLVGAKRERGSGDFDDKAEAAAGGNKRTKKKKSSQRDSGMFKRGASSIGGGSWKQRETNLRVRETPTKGVYVEGLSEMPVRSTEELGAIIYAALDGRVTRGA